MHPVTGKNVGMPLSEKYKDNFDVSSEAPSSGVTGCESLFILAKWSIALSHRYCDPVPRFNVPLFHILAHSKDMNKIVK